MMWLHLTQTKSIILNNMTFEKKNGETFKNTYQIQWTNSIMCFVFDTVIQDMFLSHCMQQNVYLYSYHDCLLQLR